jgi:hypothetical protein
MYHGFAEIAKGLEKNGFFGMLASLPLAVLLLGWFFFEGELAGVVLLGGALEAALRLAAPAGGGSAASPGVFTLEEISLAAVVFAGTFIVRGVCDGRLRLGILSAALHPAWIAALTWIFGRSTWVNGVLHRNVWRGRVRDARRLKT